MEIVKRPFLPPSGVMGNIYISSKKKATNESSRDRQNDFCNSVSVLLHLHFLHVLQVQNVQKVYTVLHRVLQMQYTIIAFVFSAVWVRMCWMHFKLLQLWLLSDIV